MACENLLIPKPLTSQCPTTLFGIPYGAAGRTVAGVTYPISAIVLHCYDGTAGELCNEMKCRTRSSVISGSYENSFHYSIGASGSSGGFQQHVEDNNISWTFGTYKNNTYASVPPPNIAINWPVLQGEHGINTTPDVYTIDIALAIGQITAATALSGCYDCPTASGLQQTQHDMLVQMLAYLAQEYNIPIDEDHIQFHDLIHCGEGQECPCTDIQTLLVEVAAFCPPCEEEAVTAPVAESNDQISYIYGITEPCCPGSPGCLNLLPWNGCFLGDLAVDGTLDSYILGLSQDPVTMQWCLTRGCLAVLNPLQGCGTVDDPLQLDLCAFGPWVPLETAADVVNVLGLNAEGCLIQAPWCEMVVECETPFTGIDTTTIVWTDGGVNGHAPSADVQISETEGNQIVVMSDGLYVNFDCADLTAATVPGIIDTIIGIDSEGTCVNQNIADTLTEQLCLLPEDMGAPEWLLGKTDTECPVFVTPESIIEAGLTITGNDCIDVVGDGNGNYSITQVLAPTQSGVENNLFCLGNGLFVPKLAVQNGFTINHALSGPYDALLTSDIIFSQNPNNIAEVDFTPGTGGLLVEFSVASHDCMDVDFTNNILTVTPILAPTQGSTPNALQCLFGQGLYVPQGAGLNVVDTNCIDLTLSNGVLTADLNVNPSGDNQVSCGPGGLFVPIAAGLIANDTDCVNHSLVNGVLSTTLNIAGPQGGVPNILSCLAGQGLYVPESHINVVDSTCIDLTFTGGVLRADVIVDPTGDNQVQCLPAGLYVPPAAGLVAIDTSCIALNLAGTNLTATPILATAQAGCLNALTCLPTGLFVPTLTFTDTDCMAWTTVGCDVQVDPILDPDPCNALECRPNGLFVDGDILADTITTGIGINNVGPTLPPVFTVTEPPTFITITNPSSCHSITYSIDVSGMQVNAFNQFGVDSALVDIAIEYNFDGGIWNPGSNLQTGVGLAPQQFAEVNTTSIAQSWTVGPGGSFTLGIQRLIRNLDGNFNGQVTIDANFINITGVATP